MKTATKKPSKSVVVECPCGACNGTGIKEWNAGLFQAECRRCHGTGSVMKRRKRGKNGD